MNNKMTSMNDLFEVMTGIKSNERLAVWLDYYFNSLHKRIEDEKVFEKWSRWRSHSKEVARRVAEAGYDYDVCLAALLHDAVEDGYMSLDVLRHDMMLDESVVSIVAILTRHSDESYGKYMTRVLGNEDASAIKYADIVSNLGDSPKAGSVKRYGEYLATISIRYPELKFFRK